ncbi:Malonyl CoA-acyl carrier protein transacylase [Nesidiocoris tenuis]|uniref:Malonyl CoA-acyl carrier protein transacylase n=1 Tax=Nesidiocoris tenuis TaxID=355587 RepID=A0ABN7BA05_9HEMI|nr:Malonyl CoA-acyl carrier protein transacylase [Nesidiocoris tenuis]
MFGRSLVRTLKAGSRRCSTGRLPLGSQQVDAGSKKIDETSRVPENSDSIGSEAGVKRLLEESASFADDIPQKGEEAWSTSPYPKGSVVRSQALHSLRPLVNPKETSIILFPGQGTQFVGMGKDLTKFPAARDLFKEASSILGYDILKLCLQGPKTKLDRTEFAQPAILVCSLAALEALKEERPSMIENCIATAGFSLGEITALVFADVIPFEKAVRLVKIRGEAMQAAAELNKGAMVTVLYGPESKINFACKSAKEHALSLGVQDAWCGIANYLFPHCKIVAGSEEAIKFLEDNKADFKLKRLKRLPVSGAFHTPHMAPAVDVFRKALRKVPLGDPITAVHSNIDGKIYRDAEHVRRQLPQQIVAPVKWEQTLHVLYERPADVEFPHTFECGPGNSLSTVLKNVNLKAWSSCTNVPA